MKVQPITPIPGMRNDASKDSDKRPVLSNPASTKVTLGKSGAPKMTFEMALEYAKLFKSP